MAAAPQILTAAEYLRLERQSETKHEYFAGQIYALAGASARHNLIVTNVVAELRNQVRRRPCRVYPNDMRVRIRPTGRYVYPDVVVVCGTPRFEDDEQDTLLNPTVVVEVLSASTEAFDRGSKFQNYRAIASLASYILIAQDAQRIEHYARQPQGQWLLTEVAGLDGVLHLPAIDCTLALADVYEKVDVEPSPGELPEESR